MSGFQTYQRFQRIEDQAKKLGFRIGPPKAHLADREGGDLVTLYPGDNDALPIFSRDADLFTGTFGQVEIYLAGWARAQSYDSMLRLSNDKKREKKEQDYRHDILLRQLKTDHAGQKQKV